MKKKRCEELLDALIDNEIDLHGTRNTIRLLLDIGFTEQELIEDLHFDADDVARVKEGQP